MRRTAFCALALCFMPVRAAAIPAAAEADVRLEWPGGMSVRCLVPLGAAGLLLRCEADPAGPIRLVAGLDAPFVRAGPLAAAGLLREAARPLGFSPGSGVFEEATGLRFDGAMSGPEHCSVQVTLIPEAFALFWLNPAAGPDVLGCAIRTRLRGPIALDAMATVCGRGADAAGEEWILTAAPDPAGRTIHAASRIGVSLSGLSATLSGGMSAAEWAPPGWFSLCAASLARGDAVIDVLAAGASRGYLCLGGGSCPGGLRAGIRFRLAGSRARFRAGYAISVDLPGFVPEPFLPSEEEFVFTIERRWPTRGGTWEAGLSASNRIETGPEGAASDDPSGSLSAGWDSGRFRAGVTVDVDRDEGAAVEISARAQGPAGKGGAGCEVRFARSGSEDISLALSAHAHLALGAGEVVLRAGVQGERPAAGGIGGVEPWGTLEWRVTDRPVSPVKARAP